MKRRNNHLAWDEGDLEFHSMNESRAPRARFSYRLTNQVVLVEDWNDGAMSVTNDAERVVGYLNEIGALTNERRVIYRDSEGRWDELKHERGEFIGFGYIGARTADDAIKAIRGNNDQN